MAQHAQQQLRPAGNQSLLCRHMAPHAGLHCLQLSCQDRGHHPPQGCPAVETAVLGCAAGARPAVPAGGSAAGGYVCAA